jgi:hypothetical protein
VALTRADRNVCHRHRLRLEIALRSKLHHGLNV